MSDKPLSPGAWFGPIIMQAMSPAERQAAKRRRDRAGIVQVTVNLTPADLDRMLEAGLVDDAESRNPGRLAEVSLELIREAMPREKSHAVTHQSADRG